MWIRIRITGDLLDLDPHEGCGNFIADPDLGGKSNRRKCHKNLRYIQILNLFHKIIKQILQFQVNVIWFFLFSGNFFPSTGSEFGYRRMQHPDPLNNNQCRSPITVSKKRHFCWSCLHGLTLLTQTFLMSVSAVRFFTLTPNSDISCRNRRISYRS